MSKKILICDDEEGIRESLKLILGDLYELIITDSGEQCLEALSNSKNIGLILLDIKMPVINGLETLNTIKEQYPDLPVFMVTGYKSVETTSEAAKLGADGYIVKPFKMDEVLKSIALKI